MALVLPFLISLLLGTATSGLALNDDMQLTHSSREGARYGATVPLDQTFGSGTWAENIRDVAVERFGSGLPAANVCVAVIEGSPGVPMSAAHTTNSDGTSCFDDSASGVVDVRVQVVTVKGATIETGVHTFDLDLKSEATAKHESNG